ncbi:hypothetical protein ACGIF2_15690 [Cellulomonas sp. P22]|uniref:hypothetical protein n=1 Tax=Cellulomonas sp. P22 TaxID=3373189 RepID=UPI0037A670D7
MSSPDASQILLSESQRATNVPEEVATILLVASIGFNHFVEGQTWTHALGELSEELRSLVT